MFWCAGTSWNDPPFKLIYPSPYFSYFFLPYTPLIWKPCGYNPPKYFEKAQIKAGFMEFKFENWSFINKEMKKAGRKNPAVGCYDVAWWPSLRSALQLYEFKMTPYHLGPSLGYCSSQILESLGELWWTVRDGNVISVAGRMGKEPGGKIRALV